MKVLFVSNDPSLFDPESPARLRMHAYAREMGELHILSIAGWNAKKGQEGMVFLHPVYGWKVGKVFLLTLQARSIIKKYNIDIVSAQDPFEHGLAALRAIQGTNAKLHVQVHTDFLSKWFTIGEGWGGLRARLLNQYRQRIADVVLPKASGVRVVSERIKKSLLERYGASVPEPTVIPIAVSDEVPACVSLPKHNFNFVLMTIGRLEPEKRIQDIVLAMKLLVPIYPKMGLFVIGEGRERRRLRKLVQTLALEEQVIFLGAHTDAWGLMQNAQAYVQVSAYEGYGRTLIEAALARTPIITTEVGIVGEVFRPNEDVITTPIGDPKTLSVHIASFIEDTSARQKLPMHAENAARAHLTSVGNIPARIVADLRRTLGL